MECDQCLLEWRWCAWLGWCFACSAWQLPKGFSVALSWVHLFGSVRNEMLQSPYVREREREYRPRVNLHRDNWCHLLLNCVKLKSVSCTSNLSAQTCDFPKYPPDVDFESSRYPEKESWNNPRLHCCAVFPKEQCCRYSLVWWMDEIKRAKRLSQDFVHHKYQVSHNEPNTDTFQNNLWANCRQFSYRLIFSSLNWWSSMHGVATEKLWVVLFASSQ